MSFKITTKRTQTQEIIFCANLNCVYFGTTELTVTNWTASAAIPDIYIDFS